MKAATLYGSPLSLYTGRARSYLIKAGIAYSETLPNSPYFQQQVLPQTGGRQSIPVLETGEGKVIRDGAAIIDHYEAASGNPFAPKSPILNVLSLLFDVLGCEGLLRPAMHYRWNFPQLNENFIRFHFETFIPDGMDKTTLAAKRMDQMRNAGRSFGAVPENFELIEKLYADLLVALNEHFSTFPYLLGGRPSIGDFGMIAPLYGHLGRDPKPLTLMHDFAVCVYRWVERMNRPDSDSGEFSNKDISYFSDTDIPQSLITVLKQLAKDFVPESVAACETINQWICEQHNLEQHTIVERGVGSCSFEVDGHSINALAQPYRFYLLSKVQAAYSSLDKANKQAIDDLFQLSDMSEILNLKLSREIGSLDNREVWL